MSVTDGTGRSPWESRTEDPYAERRLTEQVGEQVLELARNTPAYALNDCFDVNVDEDVVYMDLRRLQQKHELERGLRRAPTALQTLRWVRSELSETITEPAGNLPDFLPNTS